MNAKIKKQLQANIQKLIENGTVDKFLQHEPGTENGCIEGYSCSQCNDFDCEMKGKPKEEK